MKVTRRKKDAQLSGAHGVGELRVLAENAEATVVEGAPHGMSRRQFLWFGGAASLTVLLAAGGLSGCRSERGDEIMKGVRTITDHAGREVEIPTNLERVYFTSPLAQIFVFSLKPEVQAGTALNFTRQELAYLPDNTQELINMGSISGNGEIDKETLLAEDVQVVFSISGVALTEANITAGEKLQKQTKIPVVFIDGSFDKIADAYRFLGDCLGVPDRAEKLAVYLEDIYARVTAAVGNIPEEEKVSLYYAEGPLGLQTEPNVSQHALTFQVAGARNVAATEANQGFGMSNVSLEQVLAWDPEVIVAWDGVVRGGADQIIRTRDTWKLIKAVQDGRVYTMPNVPFAWCDRPPGVNRFMGIQWVANMLYPDRYDVDMVEATQEFYSMMYWRDITVDQALDILGNSYPPLGKTAKYTSSGTVVHDNGDTGLDAEDMGARMQGTDME